MNNYKNTPPFRRSECTVLPSGLRVVTAELPHAHSISGFLLFSTGSRYETDEESGISHLFEHTLFKGTKTRTTPRDIAGPIEGYGGILNAFTDKESTGYWFKVSHTRFLKSFEILADMMISPLLREEDIEKEKHVVFEEIRATHDSPQRSVGLKIDQMLWPDQPLGRDVAGSFESVNSITREQMLECLRTRYVTGNLVIAIAGLVNHTEVVEHASRLMADLPNGNGSMPFPFRDTLREHTVHIQERPLEQAHVVIGMHALSFFDERRYALSLLSVVLGETMISRLYEEIREKHGLAYDIGSSISAFSDTGALYIEYALEPKHLEDATSLVIKQIADIKFKGITPNELQQAKELISGRLLLRMEDSRSVAASIGYQELLRRETLEIKDLINKVHSVTIEDVKMVAETVISDKLVMAIVGPSKINVNRIEKLIRL